ncbi:MAG: hypothetical protein J6L90_00670 [Clostridia bacterium]|nr:hypothetical protein [Clostridia bacterium]
MEFLDHDMKPLFCIDVTLDKNNEIVNGSEFITRTASKEKIEEYENKQEELEQTVEKSKLPLLLRIIKNLCGLFSLMVLAASVKAGFETALKNAPILVMSGALCGILWIILHFVSKAKEKKVLKEENAEQQSKEIDEDFKNIHNELNVPDDAAEIDVLLFKYKRKNGKINPYSSGLQTTAYMNMSVKMYETDDELHIADLESVYSFAKSELKVITTVNKRISVPTWNKDEDPRRGSFKRYKMTVNNIGNVFFKPYYILEIEHGSQIFGIYFPCYELEIFEHLTGLKAEI